MPNCDLLISMTGLGLFATEDKKKRLHFLMPSSESQYSGGDHDHESGHASGGHPHAACIVTNSAYLKPNSPDEIKDVITMVPFNGRYLDLTVLGMSKDAPSKTLPTDLLDLGEFDGFYVDSGLVDENPGKDVTARVTLSKGQVDCYATGTRWHLESRKNGKTDIRPMAFLITWRIPDVPYNATTGLELTLNRFDSEHTEPLPRLHPILKNGKKQIHLWVLHVPPREMPLYGEQPVAVGFGNPSPHLHLVNKLLGITDPEKATQIRYLDTNTPPGDCTVVWPVSYRLKPSNGGGSPPMHSEPNEMAFMAAAAGAMAYGDPFTCGGARVEVK